MLRRSSYAVAVFVAVGVSAGLYRGVVSGALAVDLGIGRRVRDLGPIEVHIESSPELVFDVVASPYLGRTPRAMHDKLRVLERGSDMVLAAHFTDVRGSAKATTVETVRFERPHTIHFRLVRGPVPEVEETFAIAAADGGSTLVYSGTLGTDLWGLGERWGSLVAGKWIATVAQSLEGIKSEAERRQHGPGPA